MLIEFEGTVCNCEGHENLEPGDIYLAKRNGPFQLLTVREINRELGYIHSVEQAYPFDLGECHKVLSVK